MIHAITFLTRRCPRNCAYCDASKVKKEEELDWLDWIAVNGKLRELGVDFNLMLGNENWLLGDKLAKIMEVNKVPYAMYSTCPPELFEKYRDHFFEPLTIDNLSCAIDYSLTHLEKHHHDDIEMKSVNGWMALEYTRRVYPDVDCQGQITIHRQNYDQIPEIVSDLSQMGVFVGMNPIHWNKDGEYDFFPAASEMKDFLFDSDDVPRLKDMFYKVLGIEGSLLQNPEMLQPNLVKHMISMDWHCNGDPYGGPTIDSDGSLRCCGYRKGVRSSKWSIFDLNPRSFPHYLKAVKEDAAECPGCFWSYPWLYRYWENRGPDFGKKVFVNHAGVNIPIDQWSKRVVGE